MEELDQMTQTGDMLNFVLPKNASSYIKVMGVGGGGGNAVNHMYKAGIQGVDFIICNTDAAALDKSPVPNKIQLGRGLGAGNNPEVARQAALEKRDEIKDALSGTKMLFLTAGMGGGTGTGATPVVAAIAKEIELVEDEVHSILTVAIVTKPFSFEGRKRIEQAKVGIEELRKAVDAILIINNDRLRDYGKMTLMDAFAMADNVLTTAAKGISEIITVTSYVQIDFKDVNTVMNNSGVALMGFGTACGENRAKDAVEMAMDSPLLNDNSIDGAKNILLYLSYGPDALLDMDEIETITSALHERTGDDADMIWGAGQDDTLGSSLNVTLIATGFREKEPDREDEIINGRKKQERFVLDSGYQTARKIGNTLRREPEVVAATAAVAPEAVPAAPAAKKTILYLDEDFTSTPVAAGGDPVTEPNINVDQEVEEWMSDIDVLAMVQNQEATAAPAEKTPMAVASEPEPVREEKSLTIDFDTEEDVEEDRDADVEVEQEIILQSPQRQMQMEMVAEAAPVAVAEETPAVTDSVAAPSPRQTTPPPATGSLQGMCTAASERMRRLHEISQMIRTQQGLHELESVPAYMRQEVPVSSILPSDVSEASRTTIGSDGSLYTHPPFLSEKAD